MQNDIFNIKKIIILKKKKKSYIATLFLISVRILRVVHNKNEFQDLEHACFYKDFEEV